MNFYLGGYYLTQDISRHKLLTQDVLHPKDIALSWVKASENDYKEYRQQLNFTEEKYLEMQIALDDLFQKQKYGWLSVFLNLDDARKFAKVFLKQVSNIRLIGIATSDKYRKRFLKMNKPKENEGASGVYLSLESGQIVDISHGLKGFEILEFGFGYFRSVIDLDLEKDFAKTSGIGRNSLGFLTNWEDACRATDYLYMPSVNVSWQPWAVFELPLEGDVDA